MGDEETENIIIIKQIFSKQNKEEKRKLNSGSNADMGVCCS